MDCAEIPKSRIIQLLKRDAHNREYHNTYMKERRRKERELGIKQPSVKSKGTQYLNEYVYKQNAIKCIKYLFK
jgi:isopentenyldiphosphate isomerase